jgi:hypothetical protein
MFMPCHQRVTMIVVVLAAVLAIGGCNRRPPTEQQSATTVQPPNPEPVTITGCLKKGVIADDTFVLIASRSEGANATATYQLIPNPDVNLRDYIGQQVEVSGAVQSQTDVTSTAGKTTTQSSAKATGGSPTVQTKTDVDVKRLEVSSVKPSGGSCQE